MLGLPDGVTACLFDLDGVLTDTAAVHDAAWKSAFDAFLSDRADREGTEFVPFDADDDYSRYVDGKPREAGVRDFLASRDIHPDDATIESVAAAKNRDLLQRIESDGVDVYEGSRRYLAAARAAGLRRAVVSSSANTAQVLAVTGLAEFVEARVDGNTLKEQGLAGKPAPDSFLAGARELGVEPSACAVFEDALSGVEAGRAGGFGVVVGVDRHGRPDALREHGADVVVSDLADLLA